MLFLKVCLTRRAKLYDPVETVLRPSCGYFTMPLSADSIIAILGVLVALPPSILIVVTAVRRKWPCNTHYSPARHQYNLSPRNTSPGRATPSQAIHLHPPSHPSSRNAPYFHLQRIRPVTLTPRPPSTAQALIRPPPPAYQPLHLRSDIHIGG
jgi:hypothetical protein